jgi:hypothetical protein
MGVTTLSPSRQIVPRRSWPRGNRAGTTLVDSGQEPQVWLAFPVDALPAAPELFADAGPMGFRTLGYLLRCLKSARGMTGGSRVPFAPPRFEAERGFIGCAYGSQLGLAALPGIFG